MDGLHRIPLFKVLKKDYCEKVKDWYEQDVSLLVQGEQITQRSNWNYKVHVIILALSLLPVVSLDARFVHSLEVVFVHFVPRFMQLILEVKVVFLVYLTEDVELVIATTNLELPHLEEHFTINPF